MSADSGDAMNAADLLQNLGRGVSLPGFTFDANGCARLLVDGKIAVNFEHDAANDCLQIYSTLGTVPSEGREAVFLQLLEGNLFGARTAGATLAVDTLYNEIVLCRSVPLDGADPASFADLVARFISAVEEWGALLETPSGAPVASGEPAPEPVEPRVQAHFMRV